MAEKTRERENEKTGHWEKQVGAYVEKWKDILNLRDWRISIDIEEEELPDSPDKEESAACIYHCFEHHEAQMHILHPDKWSEINSFWADWDESRLESIVIHELLHLHFTHVDSRVSWKLEREELALNQLTDAFLGLDRRIHDESR